MGNDHTHDSYVTVRFEACPEFVTDHWGDVVCAQCGWLADDHLPALAGITSRAAA
jgi:hypothetical protein